MPQGIRDQVQALLEEAHALDQYATEQRARAGGLLRAAGYGEPKRQAQAPAELGIDSRLAEILIQLFVRGWMDARASALPPRFPAAPPDRGQH